MFEELGDGELALWQQFNLIEPIAMPWWQTGVVASAVANYSWHGGNRKPEHFMPRIRQRITRDNPTPPDVLFKQAVAALTACGKRIINANESHAD